MCTQKLTRSQLSLAHSAKVKTDMPEYARYPKVTESDSWKRHIAVLSPVFVHCQITGHIKPECVVLGRKDEVQQEQLADRVADVEDL